MVFGKKEMIITGLGVTGAVIGATAAVLINKKIKKNAENAEKVEKDEKEKVVYEASEVFENDFEMDKDKKRKKKK